MDKSTAIKFIFVNPRNKNYARYTINDNEEIHTMNYDKLFQFIARLVPSQTVVLRDMISRFRSFIVSVEDQRIDELVFDFQTERQKLKDDIKKHKMTDIVKVLNEEKKQKKKDSLRFNSLKSIAKSTKLPLSKKGYIP